MSNKIFQDVDALAPALAIAVLLMFLVAGVVALVLAALTGVYLGVSELIDLGWDLVRRLAG